VARALAEPLVALTEASSKIATATAAATTEISAAATASSAGIAASLDNQAAEIRAIVDEAIAAAGGYASRTEVATDVVGRTLGDMPAAVRDLQESIAAVDQKFSDLATALLTAQAEATQVLQATPEKLSESLTALTSAATTVAEAERTLAATSQETTRQVTSLTTTATEFSGSASRSADAIADILGKTQQALADMPGTMRTLHEGVTGLGSHFADLARAIADARAASDQLRQAITELRTTPQPPEAPQSQPEIWQPQMEREPSPWQPTAQQQADYWPQPDVPQPTAPQPQTPQPPAEPEQKPSRWHRGR
jgi:chromosome segregation ATPase